MTVTRDDLVGATTRLSTAARSLGMLGGCELQLHEGDRGDSRPWRLYESTPPATACNDPLDGYLSSFLGWTKPEAFATLLTIANTLEAVRIYQRATAVKLRKDYNRAEEWNDL